MLGYDLYDYSMRVFGIPFPPNYYINVPCGKCIECQKRKLSGYRFRLLHEIMQYPKSIFVTLTFDNEHLHKFRSNPNKSLSLFLDRVRKRYGRQVRHFFIAEYGSLNGRLHFHGILFDIDISNSELSELWKYGFTFVGYANEITAKYIVKYLTKDVTKGVKPPRVLTSKGIGSSWLDTSDCRLVKANLSTCLFLGGMPYPLPRYYIDKMYSEREKEIMSYYTYMESDFEYYLSGRKYTDYDLYLKAREQKAIQYSSWTASSEYEKEIKLSSETRFRYLIDWCSQELIKNNLI